MALHPSAPAQLSELVDAWAHCAQSIIDLGANCRTEDFDLPTACPGWSVKDQFSHIVAVECELSGSGGPDPEIDISGFLHVRNELGEHTERGVEERRNRPGQAIVDELQVVVADRERQLRTGLESGELTAQTPVDMPLGQMPLDQALRVRCVDLWTHEQDIREALGQPGNLDSPAAAVTMAQFERVLPRIVARNAGIEAGNAVIIDVTGPLTGRMGARVVEDETGRHSGEPLFTGEPHEGADLVRTVISLSTAALGRLAGGRCRPDQIHVQVTGDESVAQRVLDVLAFTP